VVAAEETDPDVSVGCQCDLGEVERHGRGPPREGAREDVAQRGPVDGCGGGIDGVVEAPLGGRPGARGQEEAEEVLAMDGCPPIMEVPLMC
jgi:hypothetical protein